MKHTVPLETICALANAKISSFPMSIDANSMVEQKQPTYHF